MDKLKQLVEKVYNDLQQSDRIDEYPELTEKDVVADSIQDIALNIMPNYIEKSKLKEFVDASEKSYKEETFKKYINNYSEFLEAVETEFYQSLLLGLTEE